MDERALTERDICTKYLTPAVVAGGWDVQLQIRKEVYLTNGRVIVRGKLVTRGKRKFADYVLFHKPRMPIAVVSSPSSDGRAARAGTGARPRLRNRSPG